MNLGCCCGCGRARRLRGLSQTCYARLRVRVVSGEITWAELEASGQAEPPTGNGWKRASIADLKRRREKGLVS